MKLRSFFLVNLSILIILVSSGNRVAIGTMMDVGSISDLAAEDKGSLALSNIGTGAGSTTNGGTMAPNDRSMLYHTNPNTLYKVDYNQRLSLEDIKAMSQSKIRDDVIIEKINTTQSHYTLSKEQIKNLKDAGVSRKVIDAIQRKSQNKNHRQQQRHQQQPQQKYQQPYQNDSQHYQRNGMQQNYPKSNNSYKRISPGPYYQRGGTGY